MVRRSFRFGLRVGLLVGVVVAFVKLMQARRDALEEPAPGWPPSPERWTPPAPARVVAPEPARAPDQTTPSAGEAALEPTVEIAAVEAGPEPVDSPMDRTAPAKPATTKAANAPRAAKAATAAKPVARRTEPWVIPADDRCPKSHPVKVKIASKLFHLPGMSAYERTKPDRCYEHEAAATKDGFVKAKH